MKAERAKKVADQAREQLSQSLAAGRCNELTRCPSMLAKIHKDSLGSVMLILSQKPDATMVGRHFPMEPLFLIACRRSSRRFGEWEKEKTVQES